MAQVAPFLPQPCPKPDPSHDEHLKSCPSTQATQKTHPFLRPLCHLPSPPLFPLHLPLPKTRFQKSNVKVCIVIYNGSKRQGPYILPKPLHRGLIPTLAKQPAHSLAPSTIAPHTEYRATSGQPVAPMIDSPLFTSIPADRALRAGPLTALEPFSTASALSVPSAASPSVPSSRR